MTRAKDISKILTDADISGDIDVDGVTNLDIVDIDGAVDMASTLNVTGAITGNVTGNADTATALATARTIGGTSFNGTANIAVGLADTATVLATARTIGGVSFNGSANINLAGVNTAGNQNTTGNSATATKLATARTINGTAFDGTANITITGGKVGQVQNVVKTDTFGTATTAPNGTDITGFQVNITPTSTSSKVLITVSLGAIGCSTSASRTTTFQIKRNGSFIALGNTAGSRPRVTFRSWMTSGDTNHALGGLSFSYLDSPSSTSALSYTLSMSGSHAGDTFYLNRSGADGDGGNNYQSRTMSTMQCMEILS